MKEQLEGTIRIFFKKSKISYQRNFKSIFDLSEKKRKIYPRNSYREHYLLSLKKTILKVPHFLIKELLKEQLESTIRAKSLKRTTKEYYTILIRFFILLVLTGRANNLIGLKCSTDY